QKKCRNTGRNCFKIIISKTNLITPKKGIIPKKARPKNAITKNTKNKTNKGKKKTKKIKKN
ncbi:hypothetical protein ACQWKR_23850, partial [Salmonella enterica subsp. enterica serovar Infantis]